MRRNSFTVHDRPTGSLIRVSRSVVSRKASNGLVPLPLLLVPDDKYLVDFVVETEDDGGNGTDAAAADDDEIVEKDEEDIMEGATIVVIIRCIAVLCTSVVASFILNKVVIIPFGLLGTVAVVVSNDDAV